MNKKTFHYAWIILVAVSLIRGVAGPALNGSSGLFLSPVSSDLGVGIGQLSLYLSISSIVTLFWLPIAGHILNKYSIKFVVLLGIVLQAGGFVVLGFMKSIWGWYIMAIPLAMGAVLLVNLLGPVLINRWFVAKRGLAMGLMMAITGGLGAIFQPLLSQMIANNGWRFTYIIFGVGALGIVAVIGLFLKSRPEEKKIKAYGFDMASQDNESKEVSGVDVMVARKSTAFYMLLLFMIAITGFSVFQQHITTFGLNVGYSLSTIGTALSLSMIGSAIGSLLIGFASDKIGIMKTTYTVIVIGIISILLYMFGSQYYFIFASATFLHGLAMSSIGIVAPILTTSFFGMKDYEKIFSLVMIGSPLASIVLVPAYGFIYDMFKSYQFVFIFLIIILLIGGLSLSIGRKKANQ
ncbi:MAG: MFS transporter [Coprobacillus sp.]